MEQRTCPFCGGVQSESRCEICGRPTLRIKSKSIRQQEEPASVCRESEDKRQRGKSLSCVYPKEKTAAGTKPDQKPADETTGSGSENGFHYLYCGSFVL